MVTDFYPPVIGGVEVLVWHLARELSGRGHDVAVATIRSADLPALEERDGVRIHRLCLTSQRAASLYSRAQRPWAPPVPDPEALRALRRIVALERPDIVHGHDWLARSFIPIKRRSHARLVMSLHYYTLSCAKKSLMYRGSPCSGPGLTKCLGCGTRHYGLKGPPIVLGNFAFAASERAAVDMFLPVSKATARGNGLVGRDLPFEVMPNFVPDPTGPSAETEGYVAQLPDEDFFLFVGDLRNAKGLPVLLEAYASMQDGPRLVLIGKATPETPTRLPPGAVMFQDWPNSAVLVAHERGLATIVPSIWPEPFAMVILEAMVAGRPVIGSAIGGIPEAITHGENGLIVPPGDVAGLRRAMERLCVDATLRDRLARNAAARRDNYRPHTVVPRFERVYADLLA